MIEGPTFVAPARPGLQHHPARGIRSPFLLHGAGRLSARRQPDEIPVHRHAQAPEHFQIPIHRVRAKTGARHGDIVESARPFAGIVQADRQAAIGQPGEQPAAGQALQIQHPVELARAHLPDAGHHFVPVQRRGPAPAFEEKEAIEVRVVLQQSAQRRINPPMNSTVGEVPPEQAQDRQRLNHVAQRTRFKNQDSQKRDP